jgi:hypothetical protein
VNPLFSTPRAEPFSARRVLIWKPDDVLVRSVLFDYARREIQCISHPF